MTINRLTAKKLSVHSDTHRVVVLWNCTCRLYQYFPVHFNWGEASCCSCGAQQRSSFYFLRCSLTAWRHNVPSQQCLQQSMLKSIFPVNRKLFQTLAMGQGLGLLICATAITSQYLATSFHVNTPMLQSLFNYALLCVTYTSMLLCRRGGSNTHHTAQRLSRCYDPLSLN